MKPNTAQAAIYQAALSLFTEHGWQKISVETLCTAAQTSRVTFYKYYADKRNLLCQILTDDKNRIRAALSEAQENAESLAEIITLLLDLQKQSLQTVYTPPVLRDIQQSKDKVLQDFFAEMYAEKDRFMHDFFTTLQQRGLIRTDLRVPMIEAFVQQIDALVQRESLQNHYTDAPQKLYEDALSLLLNGLSKN